MKRTKRQHYVTRAYLEGFLGDSQRSLFVYGRNRDACFSASPENIAFVGNYYSFKRPDGTWDDSLETFLANHVEGPGMNLVRRLAAGNSQLSWEEREQIALALAFQEFRVPYMRQINDTMFQEVLKRLQANFDSSGSDQLRLRLLSQFRGSVTEFAVTPEVIRQEFQKIADDPARFSRDSLQHSAFGFMRIYRYMRWEVHHVTGSERFVTSDCPVMRMFPPGGDTSMSLMRPDVEIRFPLDKRTLLVLRHDRDAMRRVKEAGSESGRVFDDFERNARVHEFEIDDDSVVEVNRRTIDFSHWWIFAGTENPAYPALLYGSSRNSIHDVEETDEYIRLFGKHQL
jgi:hypothetical protein